MRTMTDKRTAKLNEFQSKQMRINEIFLGNTKVKDLPKTLKELNGLKTLRIGRQAFDITSLPLNRAKYRPLFLNKKEVAAYDNIMTKKH